MKRLINQSYKITVARGLISDKTTFKDFTNKINEELNELIQEGENGKGRDNELSDIILTCFNIANHYKIDIKKALKEKIQINKNRIR